jgi:hypothetical protein
MKSLTPLIVVAVSLGGMICLTAPALHSSVAQATQQPAEATTPKAKRKPMPRVIAITMQLRESEVFVDEPTSLDAFLPREFGSEIRSLGFPVLQVGAYDSSRQALAVESNIKEVRIASDDAFPGLERGLGSGSLDFPLVRGDMKGRRVKFVPKHIGVFLIYASWIGDKVWLQSAPVTLTVKPRLDARGKPTIKPEWLER